MCGLAGVIDLKGRREPDRAQVARMGVASNHRGPDETGTLFAPGVGAIQQRLSIVGLGNGQQPIFNEERTVAVICNGELFDYPECNAELQARGHVFRGGSDCELIVHLYEEHGEDLFPHLKGQFAFVLFDFAKRIVLLARDRVRASARCIGRGKAISSISDRRSRLCSPLARCRGRSTCTVSIISSLFMRSARAAPCSTACNRFCPATISGSRSGRMAPPPQSRSGVIGISIFPIGVTSRTQPTRRRSSMNSKRNSGVRSRSD